MDNKNECCICLEYFESKIIKLDCNHLFHYKCINKWRKINNKCPICRKPIKNIIKVKKNKIVKLIFFISFLILFFYSIILIIFKTNSNEPFDISECK